MFDGETVLAKIVPVSEHPAFGPTGVIIDGSNRIVVLYPVTPNPVVSVAKMETVIMEPFDVDIVGAVTVIILPRSCFPDVVELSDVRETTGL